MTDESKPGASSSASSTPEADSETTTPSPPEASVSTASLSEASERATGRACVAGTTASAKLLYTVLCHEGTTTQSALIAETGLDRATVRRSLARLADCGVVRERIDPTDARRKRYEPVARYC
ncbi:MAG: MarR family transcriptional regulator [Haloferacaceae archaeon]